MKDIKELRKDYKNDIQNKIDYKNKVKNILPVLILIVSILCIYVIPHGIIIIIPIVAIAAHLYLAIEKSIKRDKSILYERMITMEEQEFILKCIKEVGSDKVISFIEKKSYEIFSIEPGIPGEGTEELIIIDELGNKHIVATDTERIWNRDKWFNQHFEIVRNT